MSIWWLMSGNNTLGKIYGERTAKLIVKEIQMRAEAGQHELARNLRDRLDRELLTNVSIKVEQAGGPDAFKVQGRGELALSDV